eukprot:4899839-Lingulodinium_polyedra.AAC.1
MRRAWPPLTPRDSTGHSPGPSSGEGESPCHLRELQLGLRFQGVSLQPDPRPRRGPRAKDRGAKGSRQRLVLRPGRSAPRQ